MLFYNDLDLNNQKILWLPSIYQFERTGTNLDHPSAHGQIMFNKFNYSHYLIFSYLHSLSSQVTCFPPSLLLSSWKIPPLSTFHSLASLGTKCHISLASNIFACTHIMHWIKRVYVIEYFLVWVSESSKSVFFFYHVNLTFLGPGLKLTKLMSMCLAK